MTCGYPMAALLALFVIFPFATSIIQSPPRMVKQPSTEELLFQVVQRQDENNKPFIVECEAEGEPAPKYRWIKNGKHFDWQTYDNRISQQPGRGTLVVTVPQDEDRGYYQCFATNEWGTAMSNSVHVYKSDLNSFREDPPKEIEIQEGEPLSLKCSPPDGYPKPQVYWMIQSTSGALRSINSSRMTVDPEGTLWFSNVTRFDATNDFVYACSATSLFRNEYKLGNKVYLNVVAAGSAPGQSKHSPVKQYVSRKNFVAYRGKKAELWCIYGGTPLPEITWQKRGGPLPYGRFTTTNYGKTLVFKYVDYEDEGTYECFASNGVGTAQSYSISLHVEAKPEFTVEPQTVNAAEGETVEFRCESHGVPSPIIDWYHNGKPISEAPQNPRRQVMPNKIIIRNLEKTDTGNYACNASNSIGYVFKDAYVNVLALPPEIVEAPSGTATVNGRAVLLTCRVFGAPAPKVKWIRGGQELTGGRFNITSEGDLSIRDVMFLDAGEYKCIASNKFGTAEASGSLVVKEATRIIDGPEDFEVAEGSTATFRCNAVTDATLELHIDWLGNGEKIDFDQEPRFIQAADSSLTITKTTELDSGTYTCVASTSLDEDSATATLVVQDVPNPPQLELVKCGDRNVRLQWRPMGDNRAPILNYVIQFNTSFTPDTWVDAVSDVPATETSYNIELSPWANYTFRVIARNKIGKSPPSDHSREICKTSEDVPYKNPDNVMGRGTRPDNLVISWTAMPQVEHNGPRFSYVVHWKRNEKGATWNTEQISDWRQSKLLISNQPTFKPYHIKILAQNAIGESNVAAREVIGYSGEDVPLGAPENFTLVQVVDHNTAMFNWSRVPEESVRGHFRGYKIQTWTDEEGEERLREIIIDGNATMAAPDKFIPYSRNFARILVFNGAYDGPVSNTLTFNTPQGPPGPIDGLEALPLGSSALFLVWKKPRQQNGRLAGYRIYYQEVQGTRVGPRQERRPPIMDPATTRAKLAGLEPGTKYRITVKATTEAGEGPDYFIEVSTNEDGESQPDPPTFTWEHLASDGGLASIRVYWIPNTDGEPGSHFFIQYRKRGESIYLETEKEYYEDFIDMKGLDPGEVYEIRVVSVDGKSFAFSDPEEVRTWSNDETLYVRAYDNVATAGWFVGMMVAIAFLILILIIVCIIKRNRGGKYDVYHQELVRGKHLDYPEDAGFHEYSRPLEEKGSHGSLSSSAKGPIESDTDSMAEYGEGGETAEGLQEDGSFIGQYGSRRPTQQYPPQPHPQPQPHTSSAFATLV